MIYRSIGYEIAKVHKAIRAQFQELLSAYGVTVIQFEVLRTLNNAPGITAAQLVNRILSDSSTMMTILKRLEVKTLVIRKRDNSDRRAKQIYLTENGRRLVVNLNMIASQYDQQLRTCLSNTELQIFRQALEALYVFSSSGQKDFSPSEE